MQLETQITLFAKFLASQKGKYRVSTKALYQLTFLTFYLLAAFVIRSNFQIIRFGDSNVLFVLNWQDCQKMKWLKPNTSLHSTIWFPAARNTVKKLFLRNTTKNSSFFLPIPNFIRKLPKHRSPFNNKLYPPEFPAPSPPLSCSRSTKCQD